MKMQFNNFSYKPLALRVILTAFTFIVGVAAFLYWTQNIVEEANFEDILSITVTNENESNLIYLAVLEKITSPNDFVVIGEKTFTEKERPEFMFEIKRWNLSLDPYDDYD